MDTRADFQRLLEDMDKVIQAKRLELSELDERLESSRIQLSEREANELKNLNNDYDDNNTDKKKLINYDKFIQEQKKVYEQELEKFNEEFNELESMNQELLKENELLRDNFLSIEKNYTDLKKKSRLLSDNLEELQNVNLNLNSRLTELEITIQEQQKFIIQVQKEKEVSINSLNNEIDLLKKVLDLRDKEIERLQLDNQFTLKSLGLEEDDEEEDTIYEDDDGNGKERIKQLNKSSLTQERKEKIIRIASAFREKDKQIKLLQEQLIRATKDLERNATLIELLNNKLQDLGLNFNLNPDDTLTSNNQNELIDRCKMLENELEAKDRQINLIEFKNHQYEIVMPDKISDLIQKLIKLYHKKRLFPPKVYLNEADNNNSGGGDFDFIPLETIKTLYNNLNKLLYELNSTKELFYLLDQLKFENKKLKAQIKKLVNELNQLHASLNGDDKNYADLIKLFSFEDEQQQLSVHDNKQSEIEKNENNDQTSIEIESSRLKMFEFKKKRRAELLAERKVKVAEEISKNKNLWLQLQQQQKSKAIKTIVPRQVIFDSETGLIDEKDTTNDLDQENVELKQRTSKNGANVANFAESKVEIEKKNSDSVTETNETVTKTEISSIDLNDDNNKCETKNNNLAVSNNNDNNIRFEQVEERLRQVSDENELLELAMKEILLSIKWSDAQCCTILIDCPSLERLCQLIEARYIADSGYNEIDEEDYSKRKIFARQHREQSLLFQLIVLKSELDLLRGQNEQLRADIKMQRKEQYLLLQEVIEKKNQEKHLLMKEGYNFSNERLVEVECQTDVELFKNANLIMVNKNKENHCVTTANNEQQQNVTDFTIGKKCFNCNKLNQLINHLLECIVKIQTRVQISDDNYMRRLLSLHKIIEVLEKDLTTRERMLIASRRECHLLIEGKLMIETQLQVLLRQQQQQDNINQIITTGHKPPCPSFILFNNNLSRGIDSSIKKPDNNDNNIRIEVDEDDDGIMEDSSLDDTSSND